jgi:hypothetical protein
MKIAKVISKIVIPLVWITTGHLASSALSLKSWKKSWLTGSVVTWRDIIYYQVLSLASGPDTLLFIP